MELRLLLDLLQRSPADDLRLLDGDRQLRVEVTVPCAGYRASFAPGRREVRLVIPAEELHRGCSLDLDANYQLRSPAVGAYRSGSLEAISWSPLGAP